MLVSVIIPCFNVEAYISECIHSVISQTHPDIEIICVDNNSTDDTFQILHDHKNKYGEKIQVLKELKKGASAARNKGLAVAKGEWIQFLDADDLLLPIKIEHQIKLLSDNKGIAFIAAACIKQTVSGQKKEINLKIGDNFKALYTTKLGNTCANFFNAEKVKKIGGWNESIRSSQESDLMFSLLKSGFGMIVDNEPLTIIRERAFGQISQGDPRANWLQYISLRLEIINFLKTKSPDYFSNEKNFYYQNLFSQVRTLSKYDLDCATVIFNENFEKDFSPKSERGFSIYAILFRLFGFKRTELLKRMLSN